MLGAAIQLMADMDILSQAGIIRDHKGAFPGPIKKAYHAAVGAGQDQMCIRDSRKPGL